MSTANNSLSKAGKNRIKIISALRRALSDTLTTKIIQYSFRNAGIFDDTAKEYLLHKLSRGEKNKAAPEKDVTLEDNKQSSSSSSCTVSTSPDSSFPSSSYELTSRSVIDELNNSNYESSSTEEVDDEESNNDYTNIPQQPQTRHHSMYGDFWVKLRHTFQRTYSKVPEPIFIYRGKKPR